MLVRVMPWFNPEYYAYIWHGLNEMFPGRVIVDGGPFPSRSLGGDWDPRNCFAFEVGGKRISIDANDHATIRPEVLNWSHAHGRVNVNNAGMLPGVVPVGPVFGINGWRTRGQVRLIRDFSKTRHPVGWGFRQLHATLRRQSQRLRIDEYSAFRTQSNAPIFYLGTYWSQHPEANNERLLFLRAARSWDATRVTGGLVGNVDGLEPELRSTKLDPRRYVASLRSSILAFNHDAVHGCLGWKLGEYLALGKAILSTPIQNTLPAPLVHGVHCHIVQPTHDDLLAGIDEIAKDAEYRRHLESGAHQWYRDNLAPAALINKLLDQSTE